MFNSKFKKICAFLIAALSVFAVTSFIRMRKEDSHTCSCGEVECECDNGKKWFNVPELLVETISQAQRAKMKWAPETQAGAREEARTAATLRDIFDKIKEKSPSNESIAKVIVSLVNLQNAVTPERAIDIRNIYFMKSRNQNHMVIDFYTENYGRPAYGQELRQLWDDIFLAENFWNADFVRVRVKVMDKVTEEPLETISCDFSDVRRYLQNEISLEEFQQLWMRRKPRTRKDDNGGSGRLKRAGRK